MNGECWSRQAWRARGAERLRGMVLLLTLVLLVVMATMGYTLTVRVAAARHRDNYLIDYQMARYACDSATKYALQTFSNYSANPISRPNEPDFSEVFALDDVKLRDFLMQWAQWAERNKVRSRMFGDLADANEEDEKGLDYVNNLRRSGNRVSTSDIRKIQDIIDTGQIPDIEALLGGGGREDTNRTPGAVDGNENGFDTAEDQWAVDYNDPNFLNVPGPYGHPWPLIAKPIKFEIGTAQVTVSIEDENAKYPVGWAMLDDKKVEREVVAGFETFCQWMQTEESRFDIEELKLEFEVIKKIKPFSMEFKPIKVQEKQTVRSALPAARTGRTTSSGRTTSKTAAPRTTTATRTVTRSLPATLHTSDFAKLCHTPLIDSETLGMPTVKSGERRESLLKYMGMWGTNSVNINSAPRHVLEAAFTFGGKAADIADDVIKERQRKPFKDMADLKKRLYSYGSEIDKCEKYITTVSTVFTVHVKAVSGVAKSEVVIAVAKAGAGVSGGAAGAGVSGGAAGAGVSGGAAGAGVSGGAAQAGTSPAAARGPGRTGTQGNTPNKVNIIAVVSS